MSGLIGNTRHAPAMASAAAAIFGHTYVLLKTAIGERAANAATASVRRLVQPIVIARSASASSHMLLSTTPVMWWNAARRCPSIPPGSSISASGRRSAPVPAWLIEGLRYAPLAAMVAVVAPEVVMTQGELIRTWKDPRLFGAAAATAWFFWRRDMFGTIVVGAAVFLALRLSLGW